MAVLKVENITKSFQENSVNIDVLKGINLEFENEKITTLMGPSGAGKSTLLYILGALLNPTGGEVFLDGKSLNGLSDREISKVRCRELGFVFQFYNLVPVLNVEENISLPLMIDRKDVKKYSEKIDRLIWMVGLEHRRRHKPSQLSGGEQQRVAIARALINNPKIILADEPTGNLDSRTSEEILKMLRDICDKEKKTVIMVTHDPNIASYSDRKIHLKDGKILQTE